MGEAKFTPGPWVARYSDRVTRPHDTDGTLSVAHVYECREQRANQRLIAAAPDLYEALEPVKRGASEADYYCPEDVADDHVVLISMTIGELRAARAALAKANPPPPPPSPGNEGGET